MLFNAEHRFPKRIDILTAMHLEHAKNTFAVLWFLLALALGFAFNVTSPTAWAVLAGLAVIPPVVMRRFWMPPPQTLSESIQEARR